MEKEAEMAGDRAEARRLHDKASTYDHEGRMLQLLMWGKQ